MAIESVAHHFRFWSYLHEDSVLSAGKRIPVEVFARDEERLFSFFAVLCFIAGIIGYFMLTQANRLYVAQLPRWKQWFYWPFP